MVVKDVIFGILSKNSFINGVGKWESRRLTGPWEQQLKSPTLSKS